MSDIRVGDTVTWKPKHKHKKIPEIMTGRVVSLHNARKPWAGVRVAEPLEGTWCVDLDRLARVEDTQETETTVAVTAIGAVQAIAPLADENTIVKAGADPATVRRAALLADLTAMANSLETGDDAEEEIALLLNNVAYAIHRGYVADLLACMEPLTDAWLDGALREMPQEASE